MGGGTGGYVNIQLITYSNEPKQDPGTLTWTLSRMSQLVFTPAETPKTRSQKMPQLPPSGPGPKPGKTPAGKVALGGLTNADVAKFDLYAYADKARTNLTGMGTAPSPDIIAKEAQEAFGGPWAGFAVALGPAGGTFDLVADVALKPAWTTQRAAKPFQIIPIVMAFGTDSFVDHYLLSLIVAQRTLDLVDSAVTQPYR